LILAAAILLVCFSIPELLLTRANPAQSTNSPVLIPLPDWLTIPYLPLNLAAFVAFVYSGFYILLEPVVGTVLLPVIFGWTAYANHLTSTYPYDANVAGVVVEVVAWIAQFIGHGVFEGRAPALLDNLLQSLVLAPFFVFMEVLFKFGYRPELHKRVQVGVLKEIKKFHTEKAAAAAAKQKAN
jgi:uncharacterized membrane protein YGL010W